MEKIKAWFGELSLGGKVFIVAAIVIVVISIIQGVA